MLCVFLNRILKDSREDPLCYPETNDCITYSANRLAESPTQILKLNFENILKD